MNQTANYPLLKSSDAKKRYQAVKEIARAKDEEMLSTLEKLATSDPDEQVRLVAAKAQKYISQGLESVSATPAPSKKSLSKEDEQRANDYVNEGLGYQLNGERNKALKSLAKAIQLNPSLERDAYFVSVLSATTGHEGEEAMSMIRDKEKIKQVKVNEMQLAREKRMQNHIADTQKSTWPTALMDLAIFTCILLGGTILAVMILGQAAGGTITGYYASVDAYNEMLQTDPLHATAPDPIDPAFWQQAQELRHIGLTTALIAGLVFGVGSLISMIIQLVLTHIVARFMFKGKASLPHLIYKVVSFYNGKMPVLFVIIIVGILVTFAGGSQTIATIFTGIVSLYSLFLSFKTIGQVTATYDFGMMRGCLSTIIAGTIVSILGFVAQLALLASLTLAITASIGT